MLVRLVLDAATVKRSPCAAVIDLARALCFVGGRAGSSDSELELRARLAVELLRSRVSADIAVRSQRQSALGPRNSLFQLSLFANFDSELVFRFSLVTPSVK